MPIDSLLTFLIAASLLSLAPGPDNIFVLTQSALFGKKSGILVTLGLCTGLIFHTTAVALGVAVIFSTSVLAFTLLKVAGSAYLLYLAWQAFKAGPEKLNGEAGASQKAGALYRRGIIMNITNPKVSIFFLAFLPQFVRPEDGAVIFQTFIFGAIFICVALIIFSLIVILSANLGQWMNRSPIVQKNLNRIAGIVFCGLALKLLSSGMDIES